MLRLILPADGNQLGSVFGGVILDQIDRVAYITASRHSGGPCVTASFDRVDFIAPVFVGDIVHFDARVTYVGRSSMEVWIRVESERVGTRALALVGNAFVTMVAIGPDKKPRPVAPLELTNDEERRLFAEAEQRMQARTMSRAGGPATPPRM